MLALAALLATSCSSSPGSLAYRLTDQGRLLTDGAPAHMTQAAIQAARADAVPLLYEFAVEANEVTGPTVPGAPFPAQTLDDKAAALMNRAIRWDKVTQVGEGYIDSQCDQFISALADLERSKRATLANLNALQSATVGIMGLAVATQKAIGIVGVAFGLAASLVDNTASSVLYELPAASVRTIVVAQRDLLRAQEGLSNGPLTRITNQGLAAARLSEYVQYCVPVSISGNVAKVLNSAKAGPTGKIETDGATPVVQSALAVAVQGIPRDVPRVMVQPTPVPTPNVTGVLLERKVAVLDKVRALDDRAALLRIAGVLGVAADPAMELPLLRAKIIVFINSHVSTQTIGTYERLVVVPPSPPPGGPQ